MSALLVSEPPSVLKLLSHKVRWRLVGHLARSDRRVSELVALLQEKQSLVSYHLAQLRNAGLLSERRSSADARDVYYRLDLTKMESELDDSARAVHPALSLAGGAGANDGVSPKARVLFLCTGNSARSQMAEAILRQLSHGSVHAQSAGSSPRGVHQMATTVLAELRINSDGLRSKSLNEFVEERFDYIISLCDNVREDCPVFPGDPERIHWSFADPVAAGDDAAALRAAFLQTARELTVRIRYLVTAIEKGWGRR